MKFQGIMPALITPLNADESINTAVLADLLEGLLAKGVDGFYVAGATGEGLALRPAERRVLAEETIRIVAHRKPCIIQVASTDFSEAVALAKHAEAIGAEAISATAPIFFKYDENDVYNYYKALADAVHIPLMMYYSPMANFPMDAKFAARCFEIDNVTAIKWTSPNYYQMMELKNMTHGEMNIINGPDEMLLMGLNAGADGGIGSTYNVMPEMYLRVFNSFRAGDIATATATQRKVASIVTELIRHPVIPSVKAVLEEMGYAVGQATFPMKRLTETERADLIAAVKAAGLSLEKFA